MFNYKEIPGCTKTLVSSKWVSPTGFLLFFKNITLLSYIYKLAL
jgi:hypothetical protein